MPATAKAATTPGTRDFLLTAARRLSSDPSPAVRREVAVAMRDEPIESSREILAELAERFDGKDRTYLEAWGTGATGKESALYPEVARRLGTSDPAKWSQRSNGLPGGCTFLRAFPISRRVPCQNPSTMPPPEAR